MDIGSVIKKYRKDNGLTQEEMANRLGVTTPAVNKWENGNSNPDIELLSPIARLLNISLDTLLSFHEKLTDAEIEEILRKISAVPRERSSRSRGEQGLLEYPMLRALGLIVFYISAGFFVVYFMSAFMEIARFTEKLALWSGMGRAINNLVSVVISISSVALLLHNMMVILMVEIILLVGLSVCVMLYQKRCYYDGEMLALASELAQVKEEIRVRNEMISKEKRLCFFSEKYGLTQREMEVVAALMRSEDSIQELVLSDSFTMKITIETFVNYKKELVFSIIHYVGLSKKRFFLMYVHINRKIQEVKT